MTITHPAIQKAKLIFLLENGKNSAMKHSIEKPILVDFVNLYTFFVQDFR